MHQPTQHDDGRVLRSASAAIKRFHAHCYGNSGVGGGAVDGLRAAARDALAALQLAPLASVRELNSLITEAESKGEALWSTISMAGFLAAEAETAAAAAATAAELDKENTVTNVLPVSSSPLKPADSKPSLGGGSIRPGSATRAMNDRIAAPLSEPPPHRASLGRVAAAVLSPSSRQGGVLLDSLVEVNLLEVLPAIEACDSGDCCAAEVVAQVQAAMPTQPPVDEHVTLRVLDGQDGAAQVLLLLAAAEAADSGDKAPPVVMACQDGGGGSDKVTECEELATAAAHNGVPEGSMGHKREPGAVPLEATGEMPPQNKRRNSL